MGKAFVLYYGNIVILVARHSQAWFKQTVQAQQQLKAYKACLESVPVRLCYLTD